MNPIVALWSVPRSISTAVERMMMERGDFHVLHEPFTYYFYAKEEKAAAIGMNVDPDHPQDFDDIQTMLQREAEAHPVFFKDMAYCVADLVDEAFMSIFVNTFVIRDPDITLRSHYKMNPDFTMVETGYTSSLKLFQLAREVTGTVPAVIDAEDIIENPHAVIKGYCDVVGIPFLPESLTWSEGFKPEWKSWEEWHLDAAKSTGFIKDMEPFDFEIQDVPRLVEMYEQCKPEYDELYQYAIRG